MEQEIMKMKNKIYKVNYVPQTLSNHIFFDSNKAMNNELKTNLTIAKSGINNNKQWDPSKKKINEYEMISVYINPRLNPISRSYYKLIEILTDFGMVNDFKTFKDENKFKHVKCACICEGPGGFVQALNHYLRKNHIPFDSIPCISLISSDRRIPKWKLDSYNLDYRVCYGEDKTGDLYKKNNINHFVEEIGGEFSCDFVTADGGFDFSSNFNSQEQLFQRLLFSEIYTILRIQKNGGSSVIKVFDLFDDITLSLITILVSCYQDVYICKPFSSRPANSEKYLICKGYKVNNKLLELLESFFDKHLTGINIVCDQNLYNMTAQSISKYNEHFVKNQIAYINRTIDYINIENTKTNVLNCSQEHSKICIDWVNKYMSQI